ncbi:hypothetical protein QBC39DRAFT_182251 [Podospora conica]|nr:hypothetical protein QBC39DRAFT_182251 [Schizothecium conicum]
MGSVPVGFTVKLLSHTFPGYREGFSARRGHTQRVLFCLFSLLFVPLFWTILILNNAHTGCHTSFRPQNSHLSPPHRPKTTCEIHYNLAMDDGTTNPRGSDDDRKTSTPSPQQKMEAHSQGSDNDRETSTLSPQQKMEDHSQVAEAGKAEAATAHHHVAEDTPATSPSKAIMTPIRSTTKKSIEPERESPVASVAVEDTRAPSPKAVMTPTKSTVKKSTEPGCESPVASAMVLMERVNIQDADVDDKPATTHDNHPAVDDSYSLTSATRDETDTRLSAPASTPAAREVPRAMRPWKCSAYEGGKCFPKRVPGRGNVGT